MQELNELLNDIVYCLRQAPAPLVFLFLVLIFLLIAMGAAL